MGKRIGKCGAGRRLIDAAVKGAFIVAVRRGAGLAEAAAETGFTLDGLYGARRRDPLFRTAWIDALEYSSAPRLVAANNRRGWQLRRMRHVAFTDARKRLFLDHFAWTCDAIASAEAVEVCKATVYKAAQRDRDFRAAWEEALAIGYAALEAEAVRQRLAMQRKMRDGLSPQGEIAQEFDRVMLLLNRYDRRGGGVGFQRPRYGRMKSWSFEAAIEALDKKLRALGLRRDGTGRATEPGDGPGGAAPPDA